MIFLHHINARSRSFIRNESGTTLVEFAICISLFLLILFAVIEFGRLGYNWVVAEKAMQRAVRIAAVRPPVCDGVPLVHLPASAGSFGAGELCSTAGGICAQVDVQCLLSSATTADTPEKNTADEIWDVLLPMMPEGTTRSNVLLSYDYDPRLGFVGGPYVPLITARIVGEVTSGDGDELAFGELPFTFVTPLAALAANASSGNVNDVPGTIPFPGISVTLPGEDMNQGMGG